MRCDVIDDLLRFAHDHQIFYVMSTDLPGDMPSFVLFGEKRKEIVINLNHERDNGDDKKIPFVIAHEIAHALVCDKNDVTLYSHETLHDKYEYRANRLAAKLLLPYYLDELDDPEQMNVFDFMKMFDFTDDMYDACVKIMREKVKN